MAASLGNIAFDCDDVLKLAAFWSAVLGRPLDRGSSEFFASIGGTDGERREPAWYFNKVREPKQAKNRVHVDLVNPDRNAVRELVRLGATVIGKHRISGHGWTVMQDPEGNEFCIAAKAFTALTEPTARAPRRSMCAGAPWRPGSTSDPSGSSTRPARRRPGR